MADETSNLPFFLQSYANLVGHFDEHFKTLGSNERGDTFLGIAQKLIPLTDEGRAFPSPSIAEKKSHDDGVDLLTTEDADGRALFAQSKYKITSKDELDSIISKFKHYEGTKLRAKSGLLFPTDAEQHLPLFLVITSSKLDGVRKAYEKSELASKDYYSQLNSTGRLIWIDGVRMLGLLQQLYRKSHLLPTNLELTATHGWLKVDNVYLGTVRGDLLVTLYKQYGDALFFENIRDFLGATSGKKVEDRITVNQEIIRTIDSEPAKMLERNNGVTFRAETVAPPVDCALRLDHAAIVNGCQTTMCLVRSAKLSQECLVQVKVVVTSNGWDIARAANYQNPVTRIELDLARYLRPQLVHKAATDSGYGLESAVGEATASDVIGGIYQHRIDYEEMKYLYLGIFSRKPNNLFEANYTELRTDLLDTLYSDPESETEVFGTLFLILRESRKATKKAEETFNSVEYATLFRRFFHDEKPRYRAYLAILALCGSLRVDIGDKASDSTAEALRTREFFRSARHLIENDGISYQTSFLMAFQVLADSALDASQSGSENEISQNMFQRVSRSPFSSLYKRLLLHIDARKASGGPGTGTGKADIQNIP